MQLNDKAISARTTVLIHAILHSLDVATEPDDALPVLRKRLDQKINTTSTEVLVGYVGSHQKLQELKVALRAVLERMARPEPDSTAARRNLLIEQLRLWVLAQSIHAANAAFPASPEVPPTEEALVQRQLRALELLVRDLVRDGYHGEEKLRRRLAEVLSDRFKGFQSKADPGDILSGTNFSELSAIFLDDKEFPDRFDPLFLDTPLLKLLGPRQKTLRVFLNCANQARNVLAHHKKLRPEHAALLQLCFDDIIEAVQEAHDRGDTPVNPASFMPASPDELGAFTRHLEAFEKIDQRLAVIPESIEAMHRDVVITKRRLGLVLAGLAVLGVMTAGGIWLTHDTRDNVQRTAEAVNRSVEGIGRVESTVQNTAKTTDSIDRSTSQTAQQIQEAMQGDLLVERPTEPNHYWHNFLLLLRRDKPADAESNLLGYVRSGGDKFDALLQAVEFLRTRHDRSEIRPLLLAQLTAPPLPAMRTALARLLDRKEAEAELASVQDASPNLAIPFYEHARLHSTAAVPMMTNDELLAEHALLGRFLASTRERPLGQTLQQSGAAEFLIADATRRHGNLTDQMLELMRKGLHPTAFEGYLPVSILINAAEPMRTLDYQIDDRGWTAVDVSSRTLSFSNMRSSAGLQQPPPFGKPPSPGGELPTVVEVPYGPIKLPNQAFKVIAFRYTDLNGQPHGPFSGNFGLPDARLQAIERDVKCEHSPILSSARRFQPGVQCQASFSGRADFTIRTVRYSYTGTTPDREAVPASGSEGKVELVPPPGAERFVYQILLSDGTLTSLRTIRP